jgi:hypothetical protein
MAKQAIKKGAGIVKKSGISAFKEKKGMVYTPSDNNEVSIVSNADKPM